MVDVWEGEEWYHRPPRHQADSVTIVAAPVSGTKYEWRAGETGAGAELGDQSNVRIISVAIKVTWATTQPTPIQLYLMLDGQTLLFTKTDPVTATDYLAEFRPQFLETSQALAIWAVAREYTDLLEGRSVKVECEITWAITQPTDLTMRVKWAKWP